MGQAKSIGVERRKTQMAPRPHADNTAHKPKPTSLPRQTHAKKRKLTHMDPQHSPSFKIRALLHQLRPHFIEVLRTPDFRNSKAADEIQKQMKVLMDVHKQRKFVSENQHSAEENQDGKQPQKCEPKCSVEKSVKSSSQSTPFSSGKKPVDSQIQGSYIVGGSAFGWNFITFSGSKAVYYGVTKEAYRSSHSRLGDADVLKGTPSI